MPAALVIGGSGTIGGAVARALAADGNDVALAYRSRAEPAEQVADAIRDMGRTATTHRVDTTQDESVAELVAAVLAAHGGVRTLVTAAAPVATQRWTGRIEPALFDEVMAEDATAFHRVVVACLPALRESAGSIVAITTVAGRRYVLRDVLSSAPKAAVEAVVRAVAAEEGRSGVRANAVGVGILEEGMSATLLARGDVREQDMAHARSLVPLGRLGVADDIAGAVAFLAGDRAGYITGQLLDVDGGYAI